MRFEWKKIETAPIQPFVKDRWYMDGERVLLWNNGVSIGSYSYTAKGKGRWRNWGGTINPTHWMPLPEAPK